MSFRNLAFGIVGALATLSALPSVAQNTDTAAFSAACMQAREFFAPGMAPEIDVSVVLTPLCVCLALEFSLLPPEDVAMLISDLSRTSTEASHAAYGDYAGLQQRAAVGLNKCFSLPAVQAGRDLLSSQLPDAEPAPATP